MNMKHEKREGKGREVEDEVETQKYVHGGEN